MPLRTKATPLEGLLLVSAPRFEDGRGWLAELWKDSAAREAGLPAAFVQDNLSRSRRGVLRGLHFQRDPRAQAKLVAVLSGAAWDVAVDLRPDSPTRGRWWACELSEENGLSLFLPAGFAHGFLALAEDTRVLYKCGAEYDPGSEGGIRWDDPELAIAWPSREVILSARDAALPSLRELT